MSSMRILVVEDEVLIALDMESILTDLGHEVCLAATLAEALNHISGGHLDLAVLDYHLREGTTAALADRLKQLGVPFLVCSGTAGISQLGEAFAGVNFLSKPFSEESLVGAVCDVQRQRAN